jgi:Universal stress protein family.
MKTIIVPIDLSDESLNGINLADKHEDAVTVLSTHRTSVPYTDELAKAFGSKIHLVTIRLSNLKSIEKKLHQYAEHVASYLDTHKIPYTVEHLHGSNLTDLTLDYFRTINADLISIMTEQEKSASNLLLGTYAHQFINKAFIPVLSFPNYHLRITAEDIWTLGAFNA